jgi:polyisoprenoid-binding protein YceI
MTLFATRLFAAVAIGLIAVGPVAAATWKVDPARSRIGFSGTQTGAAFEGRFETYQATIDFDPAKPEDGHALIVIDLLGAKTGDSQRDEALPGEDWFDIKRFPKARFEVKHFTPKGGNAYEALGTLSLRNVSRDIVLPFTLDIKDGVAHAKGYVELLRNNFGVGQNEWSKDDYVGFPVGVDVDLVATPGS